MLSCLQAEILEKAMSDEKEFRVGGLHLQK